MKQIKKVTNDILQSSHAIDDVNYNYEFGKALSYAVLK